MPQADQSETRTYRTVSILKWFSLLNVVWLWSCWVPLGLSPRASVPPRYQLKVIDRPQQKKFLVALRSSDDRPLCLDVEDWPNRFGQLHFGSTWVKLQSSEGTYPARDKSFGYCLGGCTIRIAPGSELTGFIVAEFGEPAAIAALSQRQLQFVVSPRVCKVHERGRPLP
jgi:hypothetical protein